MKRSAQYGGLQIGPSRNRIEPTGKLGRLTPIRESRSGGGWWFFRCECGTEVLKQLNQVRHSLKQGSCTACPSCTNDARRAALTATLERKKAT